MTTEEARAHYNFLLTLCIRKAESFGPMAFTFIKDHTFLTTSLTPEEQFNLLMATADAFADEPKRYGHKVDCLKRAADLLPKTQFYDVMLARHLHQEIVRLQTELDLYQATLNPKHQGAPTDPATRHRLIIETDMPDYYLSIAQRHAARYYQEKFRLSKEAKVAQHFAGQVRRFEPDNTVIHKEFPGACAPFVQARTGTWHVMLPFDLKISRSPEDPLEAGLRIWYAKEGYSFPLRDEMGRLCSDYDDQVLDLDMTDPHLLFVSVSPLKERELGTVDRATPADIPFDIGLPRAFLDSSSTLGPYVQIVCNIKVWFDATRRQPARPGRSRPARVWAARRRRTPDKNLRLGKDRGLCGHGKPTMAARAQFQFHQHAPPTVARHHDRNRAGQYPDLLLPSDHGAREHST